MLYPPPASTMAARSPPEGTLVGLTQSSTVTGSWFQAAPFDTFTCAPASSSACPACPATKDVLPWTTSDAPLGEPSARLPSNG